MNRNEKLKLAGLLVGMLVLMVGFWFILQRFEEKVPLAEVDKQEFLPNEFEEEPEEKALGTIKLNGKKYEYFHEFETYLFMGTDATGNEVEGDEYQGSMADFLLLAVFDKTENTYGFIQLNRDTMTEITLMLQDGSGMASAELQLCTAHWYGGTSEQSCENTVEAVSKMLGGLPIDGYYALNMEKIPLLNNAVGGVEVTLEEDFSHVDATMKKGKALTLTDEQAYYYIHDRYGVGDEENTSRMKRQKQYMKNFLQKAQGQMQEDVAFVNKVYMKLQEEAVTDIGGKQISRMTKVMSEGTGIGIHQFAGKTKLGQALGDGLDHVEFYPDKDSVVEIMTKLYGLKEKE